MKLRQASKTRPLNASLFYPIARQCILDMVEMIPDLADAARLELDQTVTGNHTFQL